MRQLSDLTDRQIQAIGTKQGSIIDRTVSVLYQNLAVACILAGQYKTANEPTKRLMELATKVYGERHPDMRMAMILRGYVCLETGQREEAGRLCRKITTEFTHLDNVEGCTTQTIEGMGWPFVTS